MADSRRDWIKRALILELGHGQLNTIDEFRLHLERMRPDAARLLACGHNGVANFRTKIGPGADDDTLLRQKIEVCRSMGVKVLGAYSGVGNRAAGDAHPEWIRVTSSGQPSGETYAGWQMDLLSPYVSEWCLPQIEEELRDYGVDGIWVDGDCWYMLPSWSQPCLDRFRIETGLEAPRLDDDLWRNSLPVATGGVMVDWEQLYRKMPPQELEVLRKWMAFTRKVFREFQSKVGELCHRYGATYTSNGTHSVDTGPDPVSDWLDYLSHDIPHFDFSGSFMASLKARFNGTQGVPHDVMIWDHNSHNPWRGYQTYPKGKKQLMQEVASAVANGAMWNNWVSRPHTAVSWEVAQFLHQRRDVLSGTDSAAEIAILHSAETFYVHSGGLFWTTAMHKAVWGAARALQMGGHHCDIVSESNLPGRISQYRLVILPNQTHLPAATVALLEEFVRAGGCVLASGRTGLGDGDTQALADLFGLDPNMPQGEEGVVVEAQPEWVDETPKPEGAGLCTIKLDTPRQALKPAKAKVAIPCLVSPNEAGKKLLRRNGWNWASTPLQPDAARPFLTVNRFGKGKAWFIAAEVFGHYEKLHYFGLRHLILDIVRRVLPKPMVRARAARPVEVSLRRKDGRLICHLVNINVEGMNPCVQTQYQRNVPTGPVTVELRLPSPPASARLAPLGEQVPLRTTRSGLTRLRIRNVDVMETIVLG